MAKIIFKDLNKTFGEGDPAVDNINLEIRDKEFLVLVGPSGCGKTTTLRMLAGLETPTSGSILIGEREVTDVMPKDRNIAMVFQSYALYPHMTVRENMSFGLKNRELSSGEKLTSNVIRASLYVLILISLIIVSTILDAIFFPGSGSIFAVSSILAFLIGILLYPELRKAISEFSLNSTANLLPSIKDYLAKNEEINKQVIKGAKVLEIEELLDRKPKQLSGGQRQRVAVGRAIVRDPAVFLMDEPLSNLDAKLRNSTRAELAGLQKRLGTTTLYVTHDQVEAMTLSHRIAVMNNGIIEQIGTPEEVYGAPSTSFVAGFIGSPQMNLVEGTIIKNTDAYTLKTEAGGEIIIPSKTVRLETIEKWENKKIILGFRPEHTHVNEDKSGMQGTVTFSEAIGSITSVFLEYQGMQLNIVEQGYKNYRIDDPINFSLDPVNIHLFDQTTRTRI